MATTVIVYPSGTTSNSNPHVLFSGGTGATYTMEMTTTGELLFSQDVPLSVTNTISQSGDTLIMSMLYDSDSDAMYVVQENGAITTGPNEELFAYTGSNNTRISFDYFDDLQAYREDSLIKGPTNIIYITAELHETPGSVIVRRVNTNTNQITHGYTGGTTEDSRRTVYYTYNSTEYIAFSERYDNDNVLTILYASDLTLVGRYPYVEYAGDPNNTIGSILYSNGKLLWTMRNVSIQDPVGSSTAYGTFNLSNNTFTTGSTQSHSAYSERELLAGTQKVYGSSYVWNTTNGITYTDVLYGYYDYSNNTYTELGRKTNASGFNSYDIGVNNQSTTDLNTNDIYLVNLYDLIHIDGSTGDVVDTTSLLWDGDGRSNRAIIFAMEYHEGQDNLWLEYYNSVGDGVIVIYG